MIQTTTTKDIYHGDGTTRRFEITFDYTTKNNVKQIDLYTCTYTTVEGQTKYNNDVTQVTTNYDFEVVDGVTYAVYPSDAAVSDGATPMAAGTAIIIMRDTPNEQLSTGQYNSLKVEQQLDRVTMVAQELQEQINRCPKVPEYADTVSETDFEQFNENFEEVLAIANDVNTVADNVTSITACANDLTNIDNASTYATNAANSASEASGYASNASTSASDSQKWAEGTDAQVSDLGGTHSSKGWAEQAASSAQSIDTALANKANIDLDNLSLTGEAKFAAKANINLSNIDNTNNAAATALNTAGISTIVETYHSGTDWYRIWSDGWCEQGGLTSVPSNTACSATFLQPFADTDYFVTVMGQARSGWLGVLSKTTTAFTCRIEDGGGVQSMFYACGYIS